MRTFEYSTVLTKFGFCTGFIANIFLIYLTVFHIKKVVGTYKYMVIEFAVMGIIFSGWELVAKPFTHNYNKSLIYFSLNTWPGVSQHFFQIGIAAYAGIYTSILSFIAVQFVYRYAALFKPKIAEKFDGKGALLWLFYPILPGTVYASSIYFNCQPDEFSDDYVRSEMLTNYEMAIGEVPHFVIIPYSADDSLRFINLSFLIEGVSIIGFHYAVIIYLGLKMHFNMKTKLQEHSATYQRLQKQFFRALVVQTMAPTFLFVLPAGPILLGPLFFPLLQIEISFQTGWLCSIFSLYPPFDSIAFMLIVTEYKKVIRGKLKYIFTHSSTSTTSFSLENKAKRIPIN